MQDQDHAVSFTIAISPLYGKPVLILERIELKQKSTHIELHAHWSGNQIEAKLVNTSSSFRAILRFIFARRRGCLLPSSILETIRLLKYSKNRIIL